MIYTVKKMLDFQGRLYLPGDRIKLNDEKALELQEFIKIGKIVYKPLVQQ